MAKALFDNGNNSDPSAQDAFVASRGWLQKFMQRNALSCRRRTTIAQKDPSHMIDKLVSYILHVRCLQREFQYALTDIIAMDETAVWSDMVSAITANKTGAKDVPLKSTAHEKVRVSVCLTAKADWKKLKPFIVFARAKRETKTLHSEYKNTCSVASSTNGWMNEELTLRWIKEIIGMFSFKKRLLAWDTFEAHLMDSVKRQLKDANTGAAYIPCGCTKYIQAPDVMWNAPFKAYMSTTTNGWRMEFTNFSQDDL